MRPFRYRFAVALDAARVHEVASSAALARAAASLADERTGLAALDERCRDVYRRVAAGAAGSASAFGDLDRALITLTELRARSADRVAARGREVAAARTQLASAVRRRSALERHRDRCRLAHDALLELRENADIDEANRARTART